MKGHNRPVGVRRAIAGRLAAERARHDERVRADAAALLDERGYTLTAFTFQPGRGNYAIDFAATDDPQSVHELCDEDTTLRTIRACPPCYPFNPQHPHVSRSLNTRSIAIAFLTSVPEGSVPLKHFAFAIPSYLT